MSGLKMPLLKTLFCCISVCIFLTFSSSSSSSRPVMLLAPARPHPEEHVTKHDSLENGDDPKLQTDVLISLMEPFVYENIDMDTPQMFAVLEPPIEEEGTGLERRDLLGDLEEIRYLNKKAWNANVALKKAGAHIFVLESKPWWDEKVHKYRQHLSKSIILSGSSDFGWNLPADLPLEIMPLHRPVGLYAPCLFSGIVLKDGKSVPDVPVRVGHINENGLESVSLWHEVMVTRTDSAGKFSIIFNEPGWWYCEATVPGEPLKGADGSLKEVELSSIMWLYVDPLPVLKRKRG